MFLLSSDNVISNKRKLPWTILQSITSNTHTNYIKALSLLKSPVIPISTQFFGDDDDIGDNNDDDNDDDDGDYDNDDDDNQD